MTAPTDRELAQAYEQGYRDGRNVTQNEWKLLAEVNGVKLANAENDLFKACRALEQLSILAEFRTTGPSTKPPCKSDALTAHEATGLRGAISTIARAALGKVAQDQEGKA